MEDRNKEISLAIPGEWVLKKLLGPEFGEIGDDLKSLYAAGRDKIVNAAHKNGLLPVI